MYVFVAMALVGLLIWWRKATTARAGRTEAQPVETVRPHTVDEAAWWEQFDAPLETRLLTEAKARRSARAARRVVDVVPGQIKASTAPTRRAGGRRG